MRHLKPIKNAAEFRNLKKLTLLLAVCLMMSVPRLMANNVQITNVKLTGQNELFNTTKVQFDISWDNSWRTSNLESNWDACWVFVKYRLKNKEQWHHATLNYTDGTGSGDGHTEPNGAEIDSEDDSGSGGSYGVFIHAASDMSQQSVTYNDVKLKWNYGVDGIDDNDRVEVSVFAIEMVYIPRGPFEIGDGNGNTESDNAFHYKSTNQNVTIDQNLTSDIKCDLGGPNATTLTSSGIGIDGDGGLDDNNDNTIENPKFPTGYKAFYVMKYELSMGQYTEFLKKLTSTQQNNRFDQNNFGNFGYTISNVGSNYSTTTPNRACNYLNWPDMAAYADWAGLRPMTELEYEKACRGGVSAVLHENPWGNTNVFTSSDYSISNAGSANSNISNMGTQTGNAVFHPNQPSSLRPLRCGIFAASATNNTRQETGATIYGVMEMGGNLFETAINLGKAAADDFKNHGDGKLTNNGYADLSSWPGYSNGKVDEVGPTGIIYKGGGITNSENKLHVSYRGLGPQQTGGGGRSLEYGFRCARLAP